MTEPASNVDEYIKGFPAEVQRILQRVREMVRESAPTAEESISYRIPAYKLHGEVLVYFAGWADHVSLHPIPPGDHSFDEELERHRSGCQHRQGNRPIPARPALAVRLHPPIRRATCAASFVT